MPGTPRFEIVRSMNETEKIDHDKLTKYHPGVGILLYFIEYSRLALSNSIRGLSKCMNGANLTA
jgi:hypothetical protein